METAVASGLHIVGIVFATVAFAMRGHHLAGPLDERGVRSLLSWDNISGLAAMVFIGAGLWRLFGDLEKPLDFYLSSWVFWLKMGLLALVLALETVPMTAFIRWRMQMARGDQPDLTRVPLLRRVQRLELIIIPLIILVAPFMARGYGSEPVSLPDDVVIAGVAASPAAGREGYVMMCAPCHGPDGSGRAGLAADFAGSGVLGKTDQALLASIRDGVSGTAMVPWREQLDEQGRRDVLAYIRSAFGR